MKRAARIIALLLTVLSLCLCPAWQTLAEAATAGDLTAYPNEEGGTLQLTYTDARSDYPNLSDAAFANFRMVATTGMGEGALYRTASPIDSMHKRNTYADAALKMAGVATVMNLMDSPKFLKASSLQPIPSDGVGLGKRRKDFRRSCPPPGRTTSAA